MKWERGTEKYKGVTVRDSESESEKVKERER